MRHKNHQKSIEDTVILFVDDNSFNHLLVKYTLDRIGIKSYTAINGKDAIDIYKESLKPHSEIETIDLILMDINMPVLSGPQATKSILQMDRDARIVYQTSQKDISEQSYKGALGVIPKTLSKDDIVNAIKNYAKNYKPSLNFRYITKKDSKVKQ